MELEDGRCNVTSNLVKINVSENNRLFKLYQDEMIFGISSILLENL